MVDQERLAELDAEAMSHIIFSKQETVTKGTDGELVVEFNFDASKTAAGKIVAYTMICVDGVTVAANTNIEDEKETLEILRSYIETNLTSDSGEKNIEPGQTKMLIDKVDYYTVIPGKKYRLEGQIVDKWTNQVLAANTLNFKPEEMEGSVELGLEVNTAGYDGHDLVAFECLYLDDTLACEHCDINDANQTVHVNGISPAPKTGDTAFWVNLIALMALVVAVGVEVARRRKNTKYIGLHIR